MFKDDLQKELKDNHMSQAELAKYLNCSQSAVSTWVLGTALPDTSYLRNITELFDMSFESYMAEYYLKHKARGGNGSKIRNGKLDSERKTKEFDGAKLFKLRKDKRITQRELSKKLGWSQKAISTWELGGKPSDEALEDICTYFNVKKSYFSPNVQVPFTPKEQADPKVIEREKNWKNPYKTEPVIQTKIIKTPKMAKENCDFEKRLDEVSEMQKDLQNQINDLRELIIKIILAKSNGTELKKEAVSENKQVDVPEAEKGFFARLFG